MRAFAGMLLLSGLLLGCPAFAVERKTGDGGAAIKKAQSLIRQLSQEKTALETEKAAWLAEKTALNAKLKTQETALAKLLPLTAEIERYKTGLESLKTAYDSRQEQLGQERRERQALVEKYNQVVGKANAIYADNQLLVQAVREREQWIDRCGARNQQLRQAGLELAGKHREKGFLQRLGELEPFTGLGQVEAETTVEDFQFQLKQLKMPPFKPVETRAELKQPQESEPADPPPATADEQPPANNAVSSGQSSEATDEPPTAAKDAATDPALKP